VGPHFLSLCQIWCNPSKNGAFCRLTDWIYFRWLFLSFGPLWVVAGDVSVKFYNCNAIYTADLLSFVKKYKMAAAAIMNCYLVTLYHPRSLLHGRKYVLKFHVNRVTTFRAMVIWKFCKFGLKCLFPPPKVTFWGILTPKHYSSSLKPPKGTSLGESASFKLYIVKIRPPVFALGDDNKKGEGKWREGKVHKVGDIVLFSRNINDFFNVYYLNTLHKVDPLFIIR